MLTSSGVYRVHQAGERTVVGFDPGEVPDHFYHAECRDDLVRLIATHACRILVFDLRNVPGLPDGMLGLIGSLRKEGVEVHVCHAPACVTAAVAVAHLEKSVEIEPDAG